MSPGPQPTLGSAVSLGTLAPLSAQSPGARVWKECARCFWGHWLPGPVHGQLGCLHVSVSAGDRELTPVPTAVPAQQASLAFSLSASVPSPLAARTLPVSPLRGLAYLSVVQHLTSLTRWSCYLLGPPRRCAPPSRPSVSPGGSPAHTPGPPVTSLVLCPPPYPWGWPGSSLVHM